MTSYKRTLNRPENSEEVSEMPCPYCGSYALMALDMTAVTVNCRFDMGHDEPTL